MGLNVNNLVEAVQFNCDVADANYAGDYTMCTYLLKMRELYRWSQSIAQSEKLDSESVSRWVSDKEVFWESLENAEFMSIMIDNANFDPFDVDKINRAVQPHGLVYSAGYGRGCRPEFYLGKLRNIEKYDGYDVMVSGEELARDLAASVAMTQGNHVYVREESLKRMLWEHIEAWRWRRCPDGPLASALDMLPLDTEPSRTLDELIKVYSDFVINHEIGEVAAGKLLGNEWLDMLVEHSGTRLEFIARAIKDHLADSMITLPALIYNANPLAIHLYISSMHAIRETLFPQLMDAYQLWIQDGDLRVFNRLIKLSQQHWLNKAEYLLDEYRSQGTSFSVRDEDIPALQPSFHLH